MTTRTTVRKVADPDDIDWDGFDPNFKQYRDQISDELKAAFIAAWKASPNSADISASRMQELATQYALERAGELIGGKYDVEEATIDALKEYTAQAVANGMSVGELARGLRDTMAFSPRRAALIAVTETATALGRGQRAAAIEQDQDQKKWISDDDEFVCDECEANADDEWYDIDDSFASGDDDIPAHPGCRCSVIYRTKRVHEEDAAPIEVVKEARCPACKRWLGRGVNAGATLHCPRCGEVEINA